MPPLRSEGLDAHSGQVVHLEKMSAMKNENSSIVLAEKPILHGDSTFPQQSQRDGGLILGPVQ